VISSAAKNADAKDQVKKRSNVQKLLVRQASEPQCGYGVTLESKLRAAQGTGCSGQSNATNLLSAKALPGQILRKLGMVQIVRIQGNTFASGRPHMIAP
jgi:hypothetical protein